MRRTAGSETETDSTASPPGRDPAASESDSTAPSQDRDPSSGDDYVIRPYRPEDRDQFLQLYEDVFGKARSSEWLEWRYGGPYTDRIRMFVAERAGELVGAEPFISLAMRAGDDRTLALQPADAMVHADHRRNGLLTRMTESALEHYTDGEPALLFNFPNDAARGAFLDLGWVEVGSVATAYRIQRPSSFLDVAGGRSVGAVAGTVADAGTAAFHRLNDAISTTTGSRDDSVTVHRHVDVPSSRLASLYESAVPDRLHAPRTEAFLDWRFANPDWDVRTYTARDGSETVASLVAVTGRSGDAATTMVLDALPMVGQTERTDALALLLEAVVEDSQAAAVSASMDTLPPSVLSGLGFLRDDRQPLSLSCSVSTVVARPLENGGVDDWTVGDRDLSDRRNWRLPLAEQDCSV